MIHVQRLHAVHVHGQTLTTNWYVFDGVGRKLQVLLEMPEAGDSTMKFKTRVQSKTNEPLFGEVFNFEGIQGRHCELLVSVYSKSFFSSDAQVGQVTIPREQVYGSDQIEAEYVLKSSTGLTNGKNVGSIFLKIIAS